METASPLNPLERLDPDAQVRALYVLGAAFVALSIVLTIIGRPLVTPAAPLGIVSFELAGTAARAQEILASWDERARGAFLFLQGLDYLYLLVYPALLSLGCLAVARRGEGKVHAQFTSRRRGSLFLPAPLASLGSLIAFAVLVAAPLDGIENYALVRLMAETPTDRWASMAWWAASAKFALIAIGLLYVVLAMASTRRAR
jgi:hypothetical protein